MGLDSQRGIVLKSRIVTRFEQHGEGRHLRVWNSLAGRVLCLGQAEDCGDGDVASLVPIRAVIGRHTRARSTYLHQDFYSLRFDSYLLSFSISPIVQFQSIELVGLVLLLFKDHFLPG